MTEAIAALRTASALHSRDGAIGLRDIFLDIPRHAAALIERYQVLMRGASPLTPGEREMIYAYLSKRNDCHFCFTSHSACAVALGIDRALFALPPEQIGAMPLRDETRKALGLALALNLPGIPRDAVDRAKHEARKIGRDMLRDAVMVAALTAFINRVIDGLGASAPDDRHEQNGGMLAEHGYMHVAEQVRAALAEAGTPAPAEPAPAGRPQFAAFGERAAGVMSFFSRFQQDVIDNGPLPKRDARAIREAVAGANGIAMSAAPRPDPFLHYAVDLTLKPHWRGRADSTPLYDAGGGDDHLRQVVLIAALGNFLDRIVIGLPDFFDRNADLDALIWGKG